MKTYNENKHGIKLEDIVVGSIIFISKKLSLMEYNYEPLLIIKTELKAPDSHKSTELKQYYRYVSLISMTKSGFFEGSAFFKEIEKLV